MSPFVSHSQNLEDLMLWRALKDVAHGFYIDVGANDPVFDSVTLAFHERGWRGISIEPLSFHHEALCAQRPRDVNLNCAVGRAAGELAFWEFEIHGWSTGDAKVAARHNADGHRSVRRTVPMRTLADICIEHAPVEIHFLKIDVEGFEKDVLMGADFSRFRPWILVIEATAPNSLDDNSAGWERLVTKKAYDLVYSDGINRFYLAREHAVLKPCFAHPPNVMDNYRRRAEVVLGQHAEHWKSRSEAQAAEMAVLKEQLAVARGGVTQAVRCRVFIDCSGHVIGPRTVGTSRLIVRLVQEWLRIDDPRFDIVMVRCPRAGSDYELDKDFERALMRRGVGQPSGVPVPRPGDIFFIAACSVFQSNSRHDHFRQLMAQRVKVCALVLDFLPIFLSHHTPEDWVQATHVYARLLFELDGVLCISQKVAEEFQRLVDANGVQLKPDFLLGWSHLGADYFALDATVTLIPAAHPALAVWGDRSVFLAVSSIEPRKGHRQMLAAFEQLWREGHDVCLAIVGRHLWLMDEFVEALPRHAEFGRRLFWFDSADDLLLHAMLRRASCLLAPSEDEGFGLPIVEAAGHGVPLLLRDIPVFRELAGECASYFSGTQPEVLAQAVRRMRDALETGRTPDSAAIRTLTWSESARNFWQLLTRLA